MMFFDLGKGLKETTQKLDALTADGDILPEIQNRARALAGHTQRLAKALEGASSVGRRDLQMLIDANRRAQAIFGEAASWLEIVDRLLEDKGADRATDAIFDQAYREWLVRQSGL